MRSRDEGFEPAAMFSSEVTSDCCTPGPANAVLLNRVKVSPASLSAAVVGGHTVDIAAVKRPQLQRDRIVGRPGAALAAARGAAQAGYAGVRQQPGW